MDQVNKTFVTEDPESPTRKIAAAVLGAIVVVIVVLVLILGIQAVRSLIARSQKTPTLTTSNYNLTTTDLTSSTTSTISGQTTTYTKMPATGPREDAMMALLGLGIMGSGIVVVSKKFS